LCDILYCPPNFNSNFKNEYAELLSTVLNFDKMIVVGDFKINSNY